MTSGQNRLTFIGKRTASQHERDMLTVFGRALWRMGVNVTIVPKGECNEAVIAGITHEKGKVNTIDGKALQAPRDGLVIYAEPALLEAIAKGEPDLDLDKEAVVINNEDELRQYIEALLAEVWKAENAGSREATTT